MTDVKDSDRPDGRAPLPRSGLRDTLAYKLGTVGAVTADRFARRMADFDLKPKHAGLLAAIDAGVGGSQQELAARMDIAPSLVVSLADHLEQSGALKRVRDPQDRRRQVLRLTPRGRALLARCVTAARQLDDEVAAALTPLQRTALDHALDVLADEAGL